MYTSIQLYILLLLLVVVLLLLMLLNLIITTRIIIVEQGAPRMVALVLHWLPLHRKRHCFLEETKTAQIVFFAVVHTGASLATISTKSAFCFDA